MLLDPARVSAGTPARNHRQQKAYLAVNNLSSGLNQFFSGCSIGVSRNDPLYWRAAGAYAARQRKFFSISLYNSPLLFIIYIYFVIFIYYLYLVAIFNRLIFVFVDKFT
jgi:hypothetical protein